MAKSRFKPEHQNSDLNLKVVAGLERLGEVFKHLLWEQAKIHGLSPIQIQILLFTDQHKAEYNTVSYLALELSVTKATISDAVRVLVKKELLQKIPSVVDQRSYWLKPTPKTETLLAEFTQYDQAIISEVKRLDEATKENLFQALSQVISSLNKNRSSCASGNR